MQEEILLPGMNFGMRSVASMVTGRRDVTIFSQPGVYNPLSSRLVRFHLASSSDWCMLGTAKICAELVNDGDAPLELISTPLGLFSQWRMLSQGSIVESTDFLTRTANTMVSTLPVEARQINAMEAVPMRQSLCAPSEVPNADQRLYKYNNDGVLGVPYADNGGIPKMSDLNCERYEVIPPKGRKTICFSPLSGVFQSNMCWPLPHCSITCELQLVADPAEVCASTTPASDAAGGQGQIVRSTSWHLELPRMNIAFLQLSSVAAASWDSIIASKGLHFAVSQMVTLQHQVTDKSPRLQFFRSLANCEAAYLTLFRPFFAAPTDSAATNKFLTQWGQAFQKEAVYCFSGTDEILKRTTPNQRNTPDADGVPTTSALYAHDANEATVKIPAAQTADQALELKPCQFQMRWGSKQIPEVPIKGGELVYHAKMARGIEALREGFGMQPSHDAGRRIFQMNLEAYPAHLSEQGLSSRAGESIQCIIQDGGTDAIHAVRAYLTLVYEQRLSLRTGNVRVLD